MSIYLSLFFTAALQSFSIVDSLPHSTSHFTQGLNFNGKEWIESTGLHGKSFLYRKTLSGQVLDSISLDERYFGEGSVQVGDVIFWLTWKNRKGFIYDAKPFQLRGSFRIPSEGWGLSFWNGTLLMSNGSHELYRLSPGDFRVVQVINVLDGNKPIKNLNELEVVGNTLYANIWQSDSIAIIDLPSGKVRAYLDLSELSQRIRKSHRNVDVLNGIAVDGDFLWITGKNWPKIYKLKSPSFKHQK